MRMKGLPCCQKTTVTTSLIQSVANDGDKGNDGIYSRVDNTGNDIGNDRGSPSFTPSIVMTMDVVGLQSVHMCNQGGVMLLWGPTKRQTTKRQTTVESYSSVVTYPLEAFSECRVEDRDEQQGGAMRGVVGAGMVTRPR